MNLLDLTRDLIALPGPPGAEEAVSEYVAQLAHQLGCPTRTDERGNLVIGLPRAPAVPEQCDILVTAHLDEIALITVAIKGDGRISVAPLGGLLPWKWGEGPVQILCGEEPLNGILSYGSIHTDSKEQAATRARTEPLTWGMASVFTGLAAEELHSRNVRPGTRIVLHPSRRQLTQCGEFISGPFLDDRADLAAMLRTIEMFGAMSQSAERKLTIAFAATTAEEVGGQGALWLMRRMQPSVAIALEIGPITPENHIPLDNQPVVWAHDSYSTMLARDQELLAQVAHEVGLSPHWAALSRGGSDASCGASHGLVARPFTLAFAAENSHGWEIMHTGALENLALLTERLLRVLAE